LRGLVDLGDRVVTDGPEVDLASFVRGMWELEKMGRSRAASAKQTQTEEQRAAWAAVVADCPWMAVPLPARSTKKQKTSSGAAASSHEVVADGDMEDGGGDEDDAVLLAKDEDLTDIDIEGIFANIDDIREACPLKYSDKHMTCWWRPAWWPLHLLVGQDGGILCRMRGYRRRCEGPHETNTS